MLKTLLFVGLLTCVVTLAVLVDYQSAPREPSDQAPERAASARIFAPGRVEGTTRQIALRSRIAGRVAEVLAAEGETVRAGEPLARLDDASARHARELATAEVNLAKAELDRLTHGARDEEREEAAALYRAAKAQAEHLRSKWERTQKLYESSVISSQEADDVGSAYRSAAASAEAAHARWRTIQAPARRDEVRIAQAKIDAAEARLRMAQEEWEKTEIAAPAASRILKIDIQPGEWTSPSAAEPAIVVASDRTLHVRAFVEEMDAPRLQVGVKATIAVDGLPGETITGRVTWLSPRMEEKQLTSGRAAEHFDTKVREIRIQLDDAQPATARLVIGLRVDVTIDEP